MSQSPAVDVFQVADLLIARATANYGDEIDVIGYYGSHAQGVARPTSDLDIFYIPADGKKPPVGRTFLVAGVLFDFWGIPWSTMAEFATGHKRGWSFAPALVHHARLLHTRTPEQAARFRQIQQQLADLQSPAARPQMIQRALDAFPAVLFHLGNLRLALATADFANVRHAGWKVSLAVIECIALVNQVFFDRGLAHLLEQLPRLPIQPQDLAALITTISTADDAHAITNAAEQLALATRQLLRAQQTALSAQQTVPDVFGQSYLEIKDGLNKVLVACDGQQPVAASATAWFAQYDLSLMLNQLRNPSDPADFNLYSEFAYLYRHLDLPDLLHLPLTDLPALAEQAKLLDKKLRQWLQTQAIPISEFASVDDLARSL